MPTTAMSNHAAARAPAVGQSIGRVDGPAKLSGQAQYVDDVPPMPGELVGRTVRSTIPRGRIKTVRLDPGFDWSELTVVTADEVPHNVVTLIDTDQPVLAADRINHAYEAIALVAGADRAKVERACAAVQVEVEPLPAVLTMEQALGGDPVVWGETNVMRRYLVTAGRADVPESLAAIDHALGRCDVVVRGRYATHHHDQLYIEPNGMIAWWDAEGVHVLGSLQCPYYVHKGVAGALRLPAEQVHISQAVTGGGFGGKEDFPTILALHAALLSKKSGRPVRMIYDRSEDLEATTKRHPSVTEIETGCDRDGRLRVLKLRTVFDAGAYVTVTPVVLSRGVLHAWGPYRWEDARVEGVAVATNTPPAGAYRGFGVPQTMWAVERHMDRLARDSTTGVTVT
jgi:CO/xanthine dehydrogenase Mo-binding subunit